MKSEQEKKMEVEELHVVCCDRRHSKGYNKLLGISVFSAKGKLVILVWNKLAN